MGWGVAVNLVIENANSKNMMRLPGIRFDTRSIMKLSSTEAPPSFRDTFVDRPGNIYPSSHDVRRAPVLRNWIRCGEALSNRFGGTREFAKARNCTAFINTGYAS